jgi:demethylmenaquinone methyltransferase/2-methoxy-6-polyprenyl-1,4-benzoquinol methylase
VLALLPAQNRFLQTKYNVTAWFYDLLDYPWERQYRLWRPRLLGDVSGKTLELGVGTGRNLAHYSGDVRLTALDLSRAMLNKAKKRARQADCEIELVHDDATEMGSVPSGQYDWLISTFMCCVMPDELQPLAVRQFERVLKPGGHFRLLEIVYSKDAKLRRRQELISPFVERVYGARFDRNTLRYVDDSPLLEVKSTSFLKADTYLLIEGTRRSDS